jgi:hypothetical protein
MTDGMKLLSTLLVCASLAVACSGSSGAGSRSPGEVVTTDRGPGDPGSGGVRFTASGEALAVHGYAFPPASADAPAFVDGWELAFDHLLVTLDDVTLSAAPDLVAGDQSKTGDLVAKLTGPWAIDLARADASSLPGEGGPGDQAVPFASIAGGDLATDGTRYAFGYDVVAASAAAKRVNLAGDAGVEYDAMIAEGCTVLYAGTATFKGDKTDPECFPDDRKTWPDVVRFRFCFKSPARYENCQNPDNDPAQAFGGEEHERGVALESGRSVVAQVTLHTDHPFWDGVVHDSPAHFDPFVARVVGQPGTPLVTLESTKGVDYTAYTDATGKLLEWRYCVEPPTDVHPKLTGAMRFDPGSVPHARGGDPSTGLRDYYDFVTYDQSTQGHLNADGLCFVRRRYPAPP